MGQRANYILIEDDKQVIHYNHWRANCIASDLYLGEKRFIEFVRECKTTNGLLDVVWMEGCVIVNIDRRLLFFWSLHFDATSVTYLYLEELQNKWKNWSIKLLYNRMYEADHILNLNYISQQEKLQLIDCVKSEIVENEISELGNTIVVIITAEKTYITQLGFISIEAVLNYGESVISILLSKNQYELPKEEDDKVFEVLVVNTLRREIIIDKSEFGLWEQIQRKWEGYSFTMGDFGYIGALKLADIDVESIKMSPYTAKVKLAELVKRTEDFNPVGFAKSFLKKEKDVKFSPDFFDNVNPKQTIIEKITRVIKMLVDNFKTGSNK